MLQKKILVLVGQSRKDLKGVHYALALAERLQAQVFVLQQAGTSGDRNPAALWLDEALPDLINHAREAGLSVSHLILACEEGIDLVIIGVDDEACYWLPHQIKPLVPSQIIQVSEKNQVRYM